MKEQASKANEEAVLAEWKTPQLHSIDVTETEGGKAFSPVEFNGTTGPS